MAPVSPVAPVAPLVLVVVVVVTGRHVSGDGVLAEVLDPCQYSEGSGKLPQYPSDADCMKSRQIGAASVPPYPGPSPLTSVIETSLFG